MLHTDLVEMLALTVTLPCLGLEAGWDQTLVLGANQAHQRLHSGTIKYVTRVPTVEGWNYDTAELYIQQLFLLPLQQFEGFGIDAHYTIAVGTLHPNSRHGHLLESPRFLLCSESLSDAFDGLRHVLLVPQDVLEQLQVELRQQQVRMAELLHL